MTKHMLHKKASVSVRIAEKIGREPYNTFVESRLHNASASVYENIQKNNLPLFVQKNILFHLNQNQQLVSTESDRQTYGSLYTVCQSRKG